MGFLDRLRTALVTSPTAQERTSGRPTSSNGASSMHARWVDVPSGATAVSARLSIEHPPQNNDLYFWALQGSFTTGETVHGAGHLGLQSISGHPSNSAINWGGYHQGGGELAGSESSLPSGRQNTNTRDYPWAAGESYTLTIERVGDARWRGSVTHLESGEATIVRDLHCAGTELRHIVMWSEVFADCSANPTEAVWSDLQMQVGPDQIRWTPSAVTISYQRVADGGCSNTSVTVDPARPGAVRQRTNTARSTAHGQTLPLR